MGTTTILNEMGDSTIAWTQEMDDYWEGVIKEMMARGVSFFIVDRESDLRTPLKKPKDARKNNPRRVAIVDDTLRAAVEAGKGNLLPAPEGKIKGSRQTKDAKEAAKTTTVAVKARQGG